MDRKTTITNHIKLFLFTALLGATAGAVLWIFLKVLETCKDVVWDVIPEMTGVGFLPLIVCTAGGFLAGLIHKRYGDYPEELDVVLGKIKTEKHYDYSKMPVILICTLIPLVIGASVGPEAGLTGIIAGLCYWIGDNAKFAKKNADELSEAGVAAALSALFYAPLFGLFAVEEGKRGGGILADAGRGDAPEDNSNTADVSDAPENSRTDTAGQSVAGLSISRQSKVLLYGLATAAAILVILGFNDLFGSVTEGFPSFEFIEITSADYALTLLYIAVGVVLFAVFDVAEKLSGKAAGKVPGIVRETICGAAVGVVALTMPIILFSGEDPMGELPDDFRTFGPIFLMGVCVLKLIMTAFCIRFGLKGGHFFPVIFACSCMGFGIAMLIFDDPLGHAIFASAVITAAMLGAQMKKPVAVTMLLLICFPFRMILWLVIGAAAGSRIASAVMSRLAGSNDTEQNHRLGDGEIRQEIETGKEKIEDRQEEAQTSHRKLCDESLEWTMEERRDPGEEAQGSLEWTEVKRETIVHDKWIDFRRSAYRFPDGKVFEPFYTYSRRDYVVIVATDEEGRYICVRQFRQGIKEVTTEFPAGGIERTGGTDYAGPDITENAVVNNTDKDSDDRRNAGDGQRELDSQSAIVNTAEDAEEAAKRELLEETGYVSDEWEHLITTPSNATIADNYAYIYAARNCRKAARRDLDVTEFLDVSLHTDEEIRELAEHGDFKQSVHIMAWLLAKDRETSRK